jgi:hypothetical protein
MSLFYILINSIFYLLNAILAVGGIAVLVENPIFQVCGKHGDIVWITVLICVINHIFIIIFKFYKEIHNNEYCFTCSGGIIIYNCISTNLSYYEFNCDKYPHIYEFLFIETIFYYGACFYLLIMICYMVNYILKTEFHIQTTTEVSDIV